MYQEHFGFNQEPFSIAPDPSFLYLSDSHNEALAHLLYGFSHGGFVLITGEVGTGKTTLLRNLLDKTPADVDVAFILNPRLTVRELLETLCDELGIVRAGSEPDSVKQYIDLLNQHLLETHRAGRSTVMIIDEAQNLTPAVLEQIRLLTNLETNEKKLLRIILIGQPELKDLLARADLRQLSQRITARYHLETLSKAETTAYLQHRLARAGGSAGIINKSGMNTLYRRSRGTPRLINIIADRALLGAYVEGKHQVSASHIRHAAREVLGKENLIRVNPLWYSGAAALVIALITLWLFNSDKVQSTGTEVAVAASPPSISRAAPANAPEAPRPSASAEPPRVPVASAAADLVATPDISRPDLAGFTLQRLAFAQIFSLWGVQFDTSANPVPCDFAPQVGLQCLRRNGGWSEINNLASPVILELWDDGPAPYYGALVGRTGETYDLIIGDQQKQVRPKDLRNSWFGSYVVLWRTPPNYKGALKQGDEHSTVRWLREKLSLIDASKELGVNERYDQTLTQAVRSFQNEEGLVADGIVGPLTWIRIADRLELPAPKLDS